MQQIHVKYLLFNHQHVDNIKIIRFCQTKEVLLKLICLMLPKLNYRLAANAISASTDML